MSINKLQASLAQATNEVTVAAANLNFDFTLVKCEAPKEYQKLGSALSKTRRSQAETGQLHITARRLGALFDGCCPSTPNLVRAYGVRCSEIAAGTTANISIPSGSILAEYGGIDGTSIWAAATSSPAAIHVQLLACMLARIWNPQQATSVWYELVKNRRKEIAHKYEAEETLHYSTLMAAAQATIPRPSLAEWDASVRAWLRTADRFKSLDQHQLRLIIENVNIPVNNDMAVYSSVMTAWTSALESMERILRGMPQATDTGPPLLGLTAWHLYPDLLAVGEKEVLVKFNDPLVPPGGRLTLGLTSPDGDGCGVYWSLSLAHLNHYGHPVASEVQLNANSERITFEQFTFAIFGAVMGAWDVPVAAINQTAKFFVAAEDFMTREVHRGNLDSDSKSNVIEFLQNKEFWWNKLVKSARLLLEATGGGTE